ncbi:MAG TPA: c-type cytochrome [Candidatus Eisenbacteria bacterium]|nr:c-type cytochrome [Candidatus Eisenbacteria bacterium]
MNYPYWQIGIPGGLLIGCVAVLHVFISHFAVGGGAYLVLLERKANREHDEGLRAYVQKHSVFFALLTLVLGAVTGVGIWFTIGLVSPEATSSLIHTFVWGWAIEWVFFFVEIAAALIYAYGWNRMDRAAHMAVGWVYFVAAWASLVIINGIITYMLTPGRWLQTRAFWDGFFNPTYWPSLVLRTGMAVVLAGMFGLITGLRVASPVRERVVRYAGMWVLLGTLFLVLPARWYFADFPPEAKAYFATVLPAMRHVIDAGMLAAAVSFVLALVFAVAKPAWLRAPLVAVILLCGFVVIGSGEYGREVARKPYVIANYIYSNDLRLAGFANFGTSGFAANAKWIDRSGVSQQAQGHEIFLMQCGACHSAHGYRAMAPRVQGWDAPFASEMLLHLPVMRGTMPPFAGNQQDRAAVAAYLASLSPPEQRGTAAADLGRLVFAHRCSMCHTVGDKFRPLAMAGTDADTIDGMLSQLDILNPEMPAFHGNDAERKALASFLASGAAFAGTR